MIMKRKILNVLRILFGVFCIFFGVNKFAGLLEFPPIPGDGGILLGIYFSSGFLKIIGVLEILFGLTLVLRKYIQISLIVLMAIMINALIFHLLHDLNGVGGALVGCILGAAVVYGFRNRFKNMLIA